MTPERGNLTTVRGSWTFLELSNDPFGLIERSSSENRLVLTGDKPEEVVSALFVAEGRVPLVHLGGIENFEALTGRARTQWVFLTSGSTGAPKQIPHTLSEILRPMVAGSHQQATWGFFTDVTRMAGIQVVIEAISRGQDLVIPDMDMSLFMKVKFVADQRVTHLSATPSQFRQLLSVPDHSRMELQQITLGGEIADQKILDGLRSAYPAAKITHVYATTETGSVMAISDGLSGFPEEQLKKSSNRIVISKGLEIGVRGRFNSRVHWTGDLVELNSGRYNFVGRKSEVINVGGAKVNPAEVEAVILNHPDVADCLVTGLENAMLGQLVGADVTLRQANENIIMELRALCRDRLAKYAVPQIFNIVGEIPGAVTGKKVRNRK